MFNAAVSMILLELAKIEGEVTKALSFLAILKVIVDLDYAAFDVVALVSLGELSFFPFSLFLLLLKGVLGTSIEN